VCLFFIRILRYVIYNTYPYYSGKCKHRSRFYFTTNCASEIGHPWTGNA